MITVDGIESLPGSLSRPMFQVIREHWWAEADCATCDPTTPGLLSHYDPVRPPELLI